MKEIIGDDEPEDKSKFFDWILKNRDNTLISDEDFLLMIELYTKEYKRYKKFIIPIWLTETDCCKIKELVEANNLLEAIKELKKIFVNNNNFISLVDAKHFCKNLAKFY